MILFVFVDGVGVGQRDPDRNPLARGDYLLSRFEDGGAPLPRGGVAGSADAALGVPGRPQSATGHTAILTGVNAPAHLGKHLLGFPSAALRDLIRQDNLFTVMKASGRRPAYANAYRCAYLDVLELPHVHASLPEPPLPVKASRIRPSASTVATASAGLEFRTFDHLRAGKALYHDVTSRQPRLIGCDVPLRTPAEAARILLDIGRENDLTMFEYFRTDEAGHAQDFADAAEALAELDGMLRGIVEALGEGEGLFVVSDHGNLEDLSARRHTLNPVPVLGFGTAAAVVPRVRSLLDVRPVLLELAGVREP